MQAKSNKNGNRTLPKAPYDEMRRAILGARYDLSFGAVSPAEARNLNKKYRNKSYVPDVLAFPLSEGEGEIVFNLQALKREAARRKVPATAYIAYMFIHACLHLKGHDHGKSMTKKEAFYLRKFNLKDTFPVL